MAANMLTMLFPDGRKILDTAEIALKWSKIPENISLQSAETVFCETHSKAPLTDKSIILFE